MISVVAEIQRLWFVLPRLWYCTMKWSKCSKLQIVLLNNRLTRFIYLWKSWTIEVFALQKKQRKLFAFSGNFLLCVLAWLPSAATEWISVKATKWCKKKATNTTNFFQVNTYQEFCSFLRWRFLISFVSKFLQVNHKGSAKIRHFRFLRWLACSCGAATSYATFCTFISFGLYCIYSFPF